MENLKIEKICKDKEQELLTKYFGNLVQEAALKRSETIDEYTKDLPLKIEDEYKAYLNELWKEYAPIELKGTPLVLEEKKLRKLMTDDDRELIDEAHKDATKQTLWERITETNHKDVTYYKGLLLEYTRDLLLVMREDFTRNMKAKKYIPQPVDTTDIKLTDDLLQLVEMMSKNVHEVWSETRIRQGWKYGEQRNDELKTHPCLVPYEDLPEEEKEYDRNTSIGTLKLIMKLGYKISK